MKEYEKYDYSNYFDEQDKDFNYHCAVRLMGIISALDLPTSIKFIEFKRSGRMVELVEYIIDELGAKVIETCPGHICYSHPNDSPNSMKVQLKDSVFWIEGNCCGYSITEILDAISQVENELNKGEEDE